MILVYDNPATETRDCWQNGKLQASYPSYLFAYKDWPVPPRLTHMGLRLLPPEWSPGQYIGNFEAMGESK